VSERGDNQFDRVYNEPDANELVVVVMTMRQWWHLDDWRAEVPDRYPNRAQEREAAWKALNNPTPLKQWLQARRRQKGAT